MHKAKIGVIVNAGIGIFSSVFPWREVTIFSRSVSQKGIDDWFGFVVITTFVLIAILALLGKKDQHIQKGIPKMGILVLSGLTLLFCLFLEAAFAMQEFTSPAWGLHLALFMSVLTLVTPYIFRANGEMEMPTVKELKADIEESADIVEDKVEAIADKIEDVFDKDDEDEDDKKEDKKTPKEK